MKLRGKVEIEVRDQSGKLVHSQVGDNLVLNSGLTMTANFWNPNVANPASPNWMAFGTGGSEVEETQTDLEAEISGTRTAATAVTTEAPDKVRYNFTLGPAPGGGWGIVREVGLFNAAAGANAAIARYLSQAFTVASGGSVSITWELTFVGERI